MMTAARRPSVFENLQVSNAERAEGAVLAMVTLASLAVLVLFAIWLTAARAPYRGQISVAAWNASDDGAVDPGALAADLEPPGLDELPELFQPKLQLTLEAVIQEVSSQAGAFEPSSVDLAGHGMPGGVGSDPRQQGPPSSSSDQAVPPWERWEIRFTSSSLSEYRRQLDFFGIELAAFGGSSHVDYAYNLTQPRPSRRQLDDPRQERRVRFTWKHGTLREFDLQLLQAAGIPTDGRVVCQFYPPEMEEQLTALEAQSGRPPDQWRKTVFGVRRTSAGYEFYVIEQLFR